MPSCSRANVTFQPAEIGPVHGLGFRGIVPGAENLPPHFHLPRHRHFHAYATLVLAGSFEEAGYAGRLRAVPGNLLIHPVLDCHVNRMVTPGITLLRLPWPDTEIRGGLYYLQEVDLVVRTAEKDVVEAQIVLHELIKGQNQACSMNDLPDLLARQLQQDPTLRISPWAEYHGRSRETVSRDFAALYGIAPAGFRSEWRARKALLEVARSTDSLCTIAARTGFSDQAHMTRWIRRITGASPSFWRQHFARNAV